jgi:hypothetical protein
MKKRCTVCKKTKLEGINYSFQICKNCYNKDENNDIKNELIKKYRERLQERGL